MDLKHVFFIIVGLVILFSCKTQKSRNEELTGLKKKWHNMNSRYNGYFNADVLMMESIATLEDQYQDNYNKILPVYEYVAVDKAQSVAPDLDNAIEKVSIVATLHRQSDWTDDCYLLIGKAQYLKKDYESSEETLEYMLKHYSKNAIQKRGREAARKRARAKGKSPNKKPSSKKPVDEKDDDYDVRDDYTLTKKQQQKIREKENKALKKKKKKDRKEREKARKRKKKGKKKKKKAPDAPKEKAPKKKEENVDPVKKIVKEEIPKKEAKKLKANPNTDPKNYFLKHRPAYEEGQLWFARTLIERDKYDDADRLLQTLQGRSDIDPEVTAEIPAVRAHLFLKQKKYKNAIPHLEEAVIKGSTRKQRSRYAYILGQIYQMNKQSDKAVAYFEKAMKLTNDYDMEFSAKLSMVTNAYETGKETLDNTRKALKRMIKDFKNVDYLDQVYFALGELALKNGEKSLAIENYRLSLQKSTRNKSQKAETYLRLANLYFEEESFVNAKNYFDSTLVVLNTTDDRYPEVVRFATNLKEIAENIEIVNLQDSLLMVSNMSIEEKKKLAREIKKEREASAKSISAAVGAKNSGSSKYGDASRNATSRPGGASINQGGTRGGPSTGNSLFFPYNERSLKKGKRDFDKKWQARPLEDNWRRSSKNTISSLEETVNVDENEAKEITDDELKNILKNVPDTDEKKAVAHGKIEEAYFQLGKLFRDKLEIDQKTVDYHEGELLKKYPETKNQLDAWYYLYLAYTDLGNKPKAKEYYDKLTNKFPESTYARILSDPNFLKDFLDEKNQLNKYYEETYSKFKTNDFKEVISRSNAAENKFGPDNIMMPKFYLLRAMAVGNTEGKDEYKKSLKEVVAKFPNSEEEKRAKEILRLLGDESVNAAPKTETANTNSANFSPDKEGLHYVIVVVSDKGGAKVEALKASVAAFNRENFKLDKLRLSNIFLGSNVEKPILVIRKFKNKDLVKTYVDAASEGENYGPEGMKYTVYAVSQSNYRQILRAKSLDGYDAFYQEHYK